MLAKFFVNRPIFAWVIAIVIMLAGAGAVDTLPVAQYPNVAPPLVRISATYTGASAETVENSVSQVIEEQLTGLDGLLYFSSTSSSAGTASIDVTFQQGTNPDTAQVQVQNKVQQALTRLPTAVQQQGVTVTKSQTDFLMIVALYDQSDKAAGGDIADYLVSNFQDPLARVSGVGSVQVFGSQYAMRVWLDPVKLAAYSLMPSDIESALEAQNTQVTAGKIGALPAAANQQLNATVTAQSKLQTPEQFRQIVVKTDSAGATVRLSDVARVELGNESYTNVTRLNGHPASGIAVMLAPGANALSTANRVRATIAQLEHGLPTGYQIAYPKDSTKFIKVSIEEVVKTLFEAIVLVVIVMFVFLQNWRATLIPAIAVPVVLLGTFGVLSVFGYSINTLTMFGMVLSIGLLVDDAIVVVENVERLMREKGLPPREATIQSMGEITGALVGIATVLSAVFLPMAFFSGSTGVIYRQFSITIVASMVLSVVVALTLTPALCATLLTPLHGDASTRGFAGWFNRNFDRLVGRYEGRVVRILKAPLRWLLLYGLIVAALAVLFVRLPTGFLPSEDQGQVMVQYSLPVGASTGRTLGVAQQVENYFQKEESDNMNVMFTIAGFNFSGSGQNAGMAFVELKDWDQRPGSANSADAIASRATKSLSTIRDAQIFTLNPPAVQGLGQSNGFQFQLQANAGTTRSELKAMRDSLMATARKDDQLTAVRAAGLEDTPQLKVDIDQPKALSLGLSLTDVNSTLSAAWAGDYVNDFVDRARVKKVYVQGDAPYRSKPEDLAQWRVRGSSGSMTPFSSFATTRWTFGPESLSRYNGLAAYEIDGSAAAGVSSGTAMDRIEEHANALPPGTGYAWSGLSYQERLSSGQTAMLYSISILVVFLCLAALYESWSIPISVLLVIPLGVIGAVLAATLRGLQNDVYFQVALLTTIGLSAKNAILIVEFAESAYLRGSSLVDAAIEGARLRLRPILMTSIAFIAGVMPLAVSTGAGANSRISIGSGIVGGTLTATVLAIFLVPLFFVLVQRLFGRKKAAYMPATPWKEPQHDRPENHPLAAALALALGACSSMAPSYERPAAAVPASWPTGAAYATQTPAAKSAADIPWRDFVLDARLRQVIDQALADSRSLRKAAADIEAARAQYRVQRAAQLPTVTAGVSGTRARTLSSSSSSGGNSSAVSSSYSAEVGLSSYELDLFGRLRSLSDASLQSYLATAETARATRISLIAETANAWLTLAADRSKLAISRSTAESAQRTMALTQRRHDTGVASMVDVRSAETTYQQARADAAALVATIAQDQNALQLLVGSPVDESLLPAGLEEGAQWLAEVPAGISSDVLLQRPDVLAAEHTLQAANANIGAARAKLFPTLSLTASGGVASAALSSLFTGGATVWSLAPSLALPIFDGGSSQANLAYTQAQKQGYIASYELTVQTAFQEVANALATRGTVQEQLSALDALVNAAADSYRLAEARYTRGADTFLNALDAQRTLYSAQSSRVTTQLAELDSRVALYRYLGGGLAGDAAAAVAQGD